MIDKIVVNKQIGVSGDRGNIALQVTADDIPAAEVIAAERAFDRFVSEITGKPEIIAPLKQRNGMQVLWTDEEREAIRTCPSPSAAVKAYREKFPQSTRKDSGITRMWLYLREKPARVPAPGPIVEEKDLLSTRKTTPKRDLHNNFDADRWSSEEKRVILEANSREDVVVKYREQFPNSTRSDDAICRQFYEAHPDKRSPDVPWTDAEKQLILTENSFDDALAKYRVLFPESARSDAAVQREWYGLRPEKRGEVPSGRKKGSTNPAPLPGTARAKYKIPFSSKQDKAAPKAPKTPKTPKAAKSTADKPAKKDPVSKATPESKKAEKAVITTVDGRFAVGQEVVHNGSRSSPFFGRVGKITKITMTGKTEHLMVSYGSQNAIMILPEFVVPVVARKPAAAAVAGES